MKTNRFFIYIPLLFFAITLVSCKNETENSAPPEPDQITKDIITDSVKGMEEVAIEDLIQVESPQPESQISSPLQITGKARGTWFFEGDFPVRLYDLDGNEISVAIATAQGEWMTEEWVDFKASMEFEAPASGTGVLVFEKSNPSDMRELDRENRMNINY